MAARPLKDTPIGSTSMAAAGSTTIRSSYGQKDHWAPILLKKLQILPQLTHPASDR